ncbi:hypothetical protein [Halarcobacter anaerophilus]|uniref:DUF2147 domain-containing protein n=1 Tax=Halarcobacter anaerophilus TaxID=877500 RepID=A0A4Q0XZT1_9BACT|nr:hypothetical protein [Halarcobacter anaerophilus]QDF28025.1 hypothetical protein AANAER_0523 [Halarcobacter anaerophilus]RXJ61461.1 hypothetical protein CRV06_13625 [Halarcobacter anaerophilus]
MKIIILLLSLLYTQLFAFSSDVKQAFAVAINDEKGKGENIQHIKKTKNDYNGTCFTKIYVRGDFFNQKPRVFIGNSLGHYESSKPVFNKKILIGKILIFKHYGVEQGVLKVYFGKKLFDARVYVK